MNQRTVKRIAVYAALILLGMLISTALLQSSAAGESAQSAEAPLLEAQSAPAAPDLEPASPSAQEWANCTAVNVAVFSSRVHVKCAAAVGGILYFAAPTSNPAHAARVLSTLSAAHVSGRTLDILYDPADTSGASIGCQASDCRLILGVAVLQ